jgi:hypothetical protein
VFAAVAGMVVVAVIVIFEGFAGIFGAPIEAEDLSVVFFLVADEAQTVGVIIIIFVVVVVVIVVIGFDFFVLFFLFRRALLVTGSFRVALKIDDGHLSLLEICASV